MMVETKERYSEVEVDNLGSRFVKIGGRFELSTPFSRFLAKALEAGVHLNKPQIPQLTQLGWQRMLAIMALYAFGKNGQQNEPLERQPTLDEIGKLLPGEKDPLGREHVRQLIERGAYGLYQASPSYLKQQYPDLLKQIGRKDDFMVTRTGTTRAIAGAVLTGTTYQDLLNQGFSIEDLSRTRSSLAEYGLSVPYKEAIEVTTKLIEDLQALTGQEEKEGIKQVLDRINDNFYYKHSGEFKAYCLVISDLCQEAGLHLTLQKGHHSLILQVLDDLGIAYGEIVQEVKSGKQKRLQRINFILAAQKQQVTAGLTEDERLKPLKENPVKQLGGEKLDQLPTTWQLENKNSYGKVGVLLVQLGLPRILGGSKITVQDRLQNCPVPVFIWRERYYYPKDQEHKFASFLKQNIIS